jgi:hypothetical protein
VGRADGLLRRAEQAMAGDAPDPGDHIRTLVGSVRVALDLRTGDLAGAQQAAEQAYAAARQTRDQPILSLVAVPVAALADAYGRPREAAGLLGAASRLRGTHDHTDPPTRELASRLRAALGEEVFAAAYRAGWELDGREAAAAVDPARPAG